jgi:inner membrane protein
VASVLSHPAAALGLAPWLRPRPGLRRLVLLGAICSVVPDLDVVGFRLGIRYEDPLGHRGLTHSIAFAAALAAGAWLLLRATSAPPRPGPAALVYLFLCSASHGLLDGMTDGGLGVAYFAPFSNERFFLPWRPIHVSPLSVSGFFGPRAGPILESEALFVWLPFAAVAAAGFGARALGLGRQRRESTGQ